MRRIFTAAAATALLGLAAGTAWAGNGYGGFQFQPNYSSYSGPTFYQPPVVIYQPPVPHYGRSDPHTEAVQRIKAAHSRYRYYSHPRSQWNSPPSAWDYYRW